MKLISELNLNTFPFWGGAQDFAERLSTTELSNIKITLEELYPKGITDTQLNDLFWFEDEWVCEVLGLDIDEVYEREK